MLVRQGKAAQGQSPTSQADEEQATRRALKVVAEGSAYTVSAGHKLEPFADSIAMFGTRVVPALEQMLTESEDFTLGGWGCRPNPQLAALALVRINGPESRAALERGLASPDPTVRMAIINSLTPWTNSDIARRMALDPVPAVRDAAIELLSKSPDPTLAELMDAAARNRSGRAIEWLGMYAPQYLLARPLLPRRVSREHFVRRDS